MQGIRKPTSLWPTSQPSYSIANWCYAITPPNAAACNVWLTGVYC